MNILYYAIYIIFYGAYYFIIGAGLWVLCKLIYCAIMELVIAPIKEIVEFFIEFNEYRALRNN